MAIQELAEFLNQNPELAQFLAPGGGGGGEEFMPKPLTPQSSNPVPGPGPAGPGGGGSSGQGSNLLNPFISQIGGIPAGTGTGERSLALQELFGLLSSPEEFNAFSQQFPNFNPSKFGLGPGGSGQGQGGGGGGNGSFPGLSNPFGFPSEIEDPFVQTLLGLLSGEGGLTGELLRGAENSLTEISKQRELNRIQQNAELFNARGLLESGPRLEAQTEIGTQESQALFNAQNSLQLEAARILQESIAQGIAGSLGLGNLGLRGSELAFRQALEEAIFNRENSAFFSGGSGSGSGSGAGGGAGGGQGGIPGGGGGGSNPGGSNNSFIPSGFLEPPESIFGPGSFFPGLNQPPFFLGGSEDPFGTKFAF